ncbi:hypothetical protein ASPWEDRAFT_118427 [Aspergillus wentii DTO 134E9]|uniref:4-hydroxy-tetrahydrodipicolinate synthase n=1 Tax=Aspergillus wentii DTO 134E9 TaxID=1073089 RepID=A0A1L9R8X1_ASPWE|nr:uncharacterized protein ASPWEDRAFT_118427 [Aspergillus wentii DTO 134E9]OJJ31307.1 hypothetical protein ASPWEDRAFT_118427 [Aspergillus wentii DTO 134E9]
MEGTDEDGEGELLSTSSAPSQTIFSRPHRNENYASTKVGVSEETIRRILKPGLYVPTVTFFKDTEELDDSTITQHAVRMAKAGVVGIITQGTYGEAVHLSRAERSKVTRLTRHAIGAAGYVQLPIIVGCGAQSTSETIELCHDAKSSGGDYALILPPSTYKGQYTPESIAGFFTDVASASPIPILIYNYPDVTGIDLDAEAIIRLSKHPNITGCKLTCNDMEKLARIAAEVHPAVPSDRGLEFLCLAGSADATVQALERGGSGVIAGLANVAPKTCVKLVELFHLGKVDEAKESQGVVSTADHAAVTKGVVGIKAALQVYFQYGGFARRPLPRPDKEGMERYSEGFGEVIHVEKSMGG